MITTQLKKTGPNTFLFIQNFLPYKHPPVGFELVPKIKMFFSPDSAIQCKTLKNNILIKTKVG